MKSFRNVIGSKDDKIDDLNHKIDNLQENFLVQVNSLKRENDDLKAKINNNDVLFESLKRENDDLKAKINNNDVLFESLKRENDGLKAQINNNDVLFESLKRENDGLKAQINNNDVLFESLKRENDDLKTQLNKFKKDNNRILDSYNENFKLLFYYYDLKPKSVLKNLQDICQEVLDYVVNICNKYDIKYWLEGGTLLGAVRHDGFLPWDDDIDLGMMRTDYESFLDVFDLELENHGLKKKMKCKLLRHGDNILYFIQISYAGVAVLDIFPYDYIENPPDNIKELYDIEKSKFKLNIRNGKSYSESIDEIYSNLNLSRDEKPFVIPGVERPGPSPFHVQKTEELFPLRKLYFNNNEYYGHKNNDYHLKKLYGNWDDLPKVLERHNRIYKLKSRPNINQTLEKKVIMLREINNSFKD